MKRRKSVQVVRRLAAADGYLELQLPVYALEQLEPIPIDGVHAPAVQFLTGRAYQQLGRIDEAIQAFQEAAQSIPAPHNRAAWLSLGECFRQRGNEELAQVVEMFAVADDEQKDQFDDLLRYDIDITFSSGWGNWDEEESGT